MSHKTGPGHNDFSTPKAVWLEPSLDRVRWQKQAVVLTNRRSFNATNDFVNRMKILPKVTIIGDKTGGGSGLPFSSELPTAGLSASHQPHVRCGYATSGIRYRSGHQSQYVQRICQRNVDTIIEAARIFT